MAVTAGLAAGATLPAMGAMRAAAATTAQQERFTNPVIWQDLADLEVIRVGDTYYYTGSTMHFSPGAPVLRSYDLVNWEFIGHSVPVLDFGDAYDLKGGQAYVQGIYASSMRYRPSDKTFYWVGQIGWQRSYVYRATDAAGPGPGTPRSAASTTTRGCSSTTTAPRTWRTAPTRSASRNSPRTCAPRSGPSTCSPSPTRCT